MNKFFKNVILILPVLFLAFNFTNVKADTILYDSSLKPDGLHHYNCDMLTTLPYANSGVHCADTAVTFTYSLDKSSYNIGDTVNASINVTSASYSNPDHSSDNTSIPLSPYLIPYINPSDIYRSGEFLSTDLYEVGVQGSNGYYWFDPKKFTCSSLSFMQAGVNCTTSFVIPANTVKHQVAPWINHGPPFSSSDYITITSPTSYGVHPIYMYPVIGYGSQDPQFGSCYSFNSSGPIVPGAPNATCYTAITINYNIPNPSTPPQIFVK